MQVDASEKDPLSDERTTQSRRDYILIIVAAIVFLIVPLIVAGWALTR